MTGSGADGGAQRERTALAWQRTALSAVAAVAIVGRLSYPALGAATVVPTGSAVLAGTWVFLASRARHRRRSGVTDRAAVDGRLGAALACIVLLLGVTELGSIVLR